MINDVLWSDSDCFTESKLWRIGRGKARGQIRLIVRTCRSDWLFHDLWVLDIICAAVNTIWHNFYWLSSLINNITNISVFRNVSKSKDPLEGDCYCWQRAVEKMIICTCIDQDWKENRLRLVFCLTTAALIWCDKNWIAKSASL